MSYNECTKLSTFHNCHYITLIYFLSVLSLSHFIQSELNIYFVLLDTIIFLFNYGNYLHTLNYGTITLNHDLFPHLRIKRLFYHNAMRSNIKFKLNE